MRRFVLLVCVGAATLLLAAGTVWAATVRCEGGSGSYNPCFGTSEDDEIRGTASHNSVFARGGSDVVRLGGGGDWAGGDIVKVKRPGEDEVVYYPTYKFAANQGDDTLYGGRGRDWVFGNDGDDTLYGGPAQDGLSGDGTEVYPSHDDSGFKLYGDDTIRGGAGNDWLDGDAGEDRLYGGEGDDMFIEGHDGDEDHLYCGEGHDTYLPRDASDHVAADCEQEVQVPPDHPPIP